MGRTYTFNEADCKLDITEPLVTAEELLRICKEIDEDTDTAEIASFISTAHNIVCTAIDGYSLPDALVKSIELYLAAHYAAITYPRTTSERLGPLGKSYAVKGGYGFNATTYGSTAIGLDPTGNLADLSNGEGVKTGLLIRSIGNGVPLDALI